MTGNIFDIQHGSLVDGPGIRTVVFFKGCNLHCAWCHNPESQSPSPQLMVFRERCIGCGACACQKPTCDGCGSCVERCPVEARRLVGRRASREEILAEILEDRPFYGADGGVTFSGGECMLQSGFLQGLLQDCKAAGIHTAVDTAGHVPWERFATVLPDTDLFLYDVKAMDPAVHKTYTGADNSLILDNLGRLLDQGAKVHIRIPVIPGVNDKPEDWLPLKQFLQNHPRPEKIEPLTYHTMGIHKYAALGLPEPTSFPRNVTP